MFSEGYVGVTSKTVEKRFKRHLSDAAAGSEYAVHRAIRKYGDRVLVQTILEASEDYCLSVEYKLRPMQTTGWNIGIGGTKTRVGAKASEETLKRLSESHKGIAVSEEAKAKIAEKSRMRRHTDEAKQKMSDAKLKLSSAYWNQPHAKPENWSRAEIVENLILSGKSCGDILKHFNLHQSNRSFTTILKKIRSG